MLTEAAMGDIDKSAKGFIAKHLPAIALGLTVGIILGYIAGRLV